MSYTTIDTKSLFLEDIKVGKQHIHQLMNNGNGLTHETVKAFIDFNYDHFNDAVKFMNKSEQSTSYKNFKEMLQDMEELEGPELEKEMSKKITKGGVQHMFDLAMVKIAENNIKHNLTDSNTGKLIINTQEISEFIQNTVKVGTKVSYQHNMNEALRQFKTNPELGQAIKKYASWVNDKNLEGSYNRFDNVRATANDKNDLPNIEPVTLDKLKETMEKIGHYQQAMDDLSKGTSFIAMDAKRNHTNNFKDPNVKALVKFCLDEVNGEPNHILLENDLKTRAPTMASRRLG